MKFIIMILLFFFSTKINTQILSEKIDQYVQSYVNTGDFSGCILISMEDSILFSKSYGKADYAFDVPNTMDTKFKIGSISKQFTAIAILQLEEKELLKTSDLISTYFPEKSNAEKITIHHLLTHTSGLVDIYDLPDFASFPYSGISLSEITEQILTQDLYFEPGKNYRYSNGGYVVLAKIIEIASGEPYEDYIEKSIFKELGMHSSGSCGKNEVVKNLAQGYDPLGYNGVIMADDTDYLAKGAGSLYSTPEDLLTWITVLRNKKFMNAKSFEKFFKNYGNNYGYGISVYKSFGKEVFGHDGRLSGYIADYLHYIEDNISVIITGNIQTGVADFLRRDIAAIIYDKKYKSRAKTIPAASQNPPYIKEIPGAYSFGPNFTVFVDFVDKRLQARANQGSYSELILLKDGRFFSRTLYAYIEFIENEKGMIDQMIWINNDGNRFKGEKINQ